MSDVKVTTVTLSDAAVAILIAEHLHNEDAKILRRLLDERDHLERRINEVRERMMGQQTVIDNARDRLCRKDVYTLP